MSMCDCNQGRLPCTCKPVAQSAPADAEAQHAAAMIAKHGPCRNHPGCGCKVQHGFDCIPF